MAVCLHPRCERQVKYPRLVCGLHWSQLPDVIRYRVRKALREGGAAMVLTDFYASERGHGLNGNHDAQ